MKFKIYASMNVDSVESWIWTNYEGEASNGYITITNPSSKKTIKCFKRTIDLNFLKIYNQEGSGRIRIDEADNVIVMNEYYRKKLEINTQKEYDLSISEAKTFDKLFLNWDHPNPQVQYGNRMAIGAINLSFLSLILGLLALILALYQIYICK